MSNPVTPYKTPRTPHIVSGLFYTPSHEYYTRWSERIGTFSGDVLPGMIKVYLCLHLFYFRLSSRSVNAYHTKFQKDPKNLRNTPRPKMAQMMIEEEEDIHMESQDELGGEEAMPIEEPMVEKLVSAGSELIGAGTGIELPARRVTRAMGSVEEEEEKEIAVEEEEEEEIHIDETPMPINVVDVAKKPRRSLFGWLLGKESNEEKEKEKLVVEEGMDEQEGEEEEKHSAYKASEAQVIEEEEESEYESSDSMIEEIEEEAADESSDEDVDWDQEDQFIIIPQEEAEAMQIMLTQAEERADATEKERDELAVSLNAAKGSVDELEEKLADAERKYKGELKLLKFEHSRQLKALTAASDERTKEIRDSHIDELQALKLAHATALKEVEDVYQTEKDKATEQEKALSDLKTQYAHEVSGMESSIEAVQEEARKRAISFSEELDAAKKVTDELRGELKRVQEKLGRIHELSGAEVDSQASRAKRQKL